MFVNLLHKKKVDLINEAVDTEPWKQIQVPISTQIIVDDISGNIVTSEGSKHLCILNSKFILVNACQVLLDCFGCYFEICTKIQWTCVDIMSKILELLQVHYY